METLELAHTIINILEEKKGEDILLLDIHEATIFTDYFVIATGTSDRMLDALAGAVTDDLRKKHRLKTPVAEGQARDGWLLIDFGDVIVHLFSPDQRIFYSLENLWAEGKVLVRLQ